MFHPPVDTQSAWAKPLLLVIQGFKDDQRVQSAIAERGFTQISPVLVQFVKEVLECSGMCKQERFLLQLPGGQEFAILVGVPPNTGQLTREWEYSLRQASCEKTFYNTLIDFYQFADKEKKRGVKHEVIDIDDDDEGPKKRRRSNGVKSTSGRIDLTDAKVCDSGIYREPSKKRYESHQLLTVPRLNTLITEMQQLPNSMQYKAESIETLQLVRDGIKKGNASAGMDLGELETAEKNRFSLLLKLRHKDIKMLPSETWNRYWDEIQKASMTCEWQGMAFGQRLSRVRSIIYLEEEEEALVHGDFERLKAVINLCGDIAELLGPEHEEVEKVSAEWKLNRLKDIHWLQRNLKIGNQNKMVEQSIFGQPPLVQDSDGGDADESD